MRDLTSIVNLNNKAVRDDVAEALHYGTIDRAHAADLLRGALVDSEPADHKARRRQEWLRSKAQNRRDALKQSHSTRSSW
jgi:hypothetical protein